MEPDTGKYRRVYGRGVFDGLKKAGILDPGEFMNEARLQALEKNIHGIAKKVLDNLPINEYTTAGRLTYELKKKTGSNSDVKVIASCLNSLKETGLVKEGESGKFIRIPPKPRLVSDKKPNTEETTTVPANALQKPIEQSQPAKTPEAAPSNTHAMDRLACISSKVSDLARTVSELASEIDDVAIEVEQQIERINTDTAKLRQLQDLLKSINS